MSSNYRSYVVRVRRRAEHEDAVRLEVEDLQNGGRATITGPGAQRYADDLRKLVTAADESDVSGAALRPAAGQESQVADTRAVDSVRDRSAKIGPKEG